MHKSQLKESGCDMSVEKIMEMAKDNNGIVTAAQVREAGLSRGILKYLVDKGLLERSARGVYILPEIWDDEIFNLQARYKKGIFSNETALFLNDMTDRTPNMFQMTFPLNYNTTTLKKENVKCFRVKEELYDLGVIEVVTPAGNLVRTYCIERTLCDILKERNNIDIQIISEAFKCYTRSGNKNIPLLSEYAIKLKVEKRLRAYLEVLI